VLLVWSASDVEHHTAEPQPEIYRRYCDVAGRLYPRPD